MTDLLIVGKGPAAWSCAITARMRGLSTLLIGPEVEGSLLHRAKLVENYPGMLGLSGAELLASFMEHGRSLGVLERVGMVRQIMPNERNFMTLVGNDVLECRCVVLAMGATKPVMLTGEEDLLGRGVSYCATCDGMLYKGKQVAVLAENEQGAEEAHFLATLAAGVDYYSLVRHEVGSLSDQVRLLREKPTALEKMNNGVTLKTEAGKHEYDGIFIFRRAMPISQLLAELKVEDGFIPVERTMSTNIPGVFAAGDCTGKPLQIAKAVGEGNVAAISAAEYMEREG